MKLFFVGFYFIGKTAAVFIEGRVKSRGQNNGWVLEFLRAESDHERYFGDATF